MIDVRNTNMGLGNSTPVENARFVETKAHPDMVELRFDHMALGGTITLMIIIMLIAYLLRQRKKLRQLKRHNRNTRTEPRPEPTNTNATSAAPPVYPPP